MPQTPPSRIEYRDASNRLVSEAYCAADGATVAVYDPATGGQLCYVNLGGDGSLTLTNGAAVVSLIGDDIRLFPTGAVNFQNERILTVLPTSDPAVQGQLWNDAGTVKVSAG